MFKDFLNNDCVEKIKFCDNTKSIDISLNTSIDNNEKNIIISQIKSDLKFINDVRIIERVEVQENINDIEIFDKAIIENSEVLAVDDSENIKVQEENCDDFSLDFIDFDDLESFDGFAKNFEGEELIYEKDKMMDQYATALQAVENMKNGDAESKEKPKSEFNKFARNSGGPSRKYQKPTDENVIYKKLITQNPVKISSCYDEEAELCYVGELSAIDTRQISDDSTIYSFSISDNTDTMRIKAFLNPKEMEDFKQVKAGEYYKVFGRLKYDKYENSVVMMMYALNKSEKPLPRMDKHEEKRVELHAHTNMSLLSGICSTKDLIGRVKMWGHKAIAIADSGVVQAYPDAMDTAKDGFKVIYGIEATVIDDEANVIENPIDYSFDEEYIVFDIETTGLSPVNDKITEIGAVKIKNREVIGNFQSFVNPLRPIPEKITQLTGITDAMVANAPLVEDVLKDFTKFCGTSILVAHNADFDTAFIAENCKNSNIDFEINSIDTLKLSRILLKDLSRHRLDVVAKRLDVSLENHHRAVDDAKATAEIFVKLLAMFIEKDVDNVNKINEYCKKEAVITNYSRSNMLILVKEQAGIRALYELVSESHINYFHRIPLMPLSLLKKYKKHFLIAPCGIRGEIIEGITAGTEEDELLEMARFYDFLEIHPPHVYEDMIDSEGRINSERHVKEISNRIYDIAQKVGIPCVATSNSHYLDSEERIYRKMLRYSQGFNDDKMSDYYLMTTDEMLESMNYLGADKSKEVVITNSNLIASMIADGILPIPKGTFPPHIDGADEDLREMCYAKAKSWYGENLPDVVHKRLERELTSIIGNGYGVMYMIAHKLVAKSMEDGYTVGSRGSVGSSFVATMSDITEVNPLPPHYRCPNCKHSDFDVHAQYRCGVDMEDKDCPKCGVAYIKDGDDIAFETFLGFEGDKEPDIDLNFAGVYQPQAHLYTEVLFGDGKTYKAGTIGTIADKTAFGYVKKYYEEKFEKNEVLKVPSKYEIERLTKGLVGVKRTTGQHPGGIMVIPAEKDVYDFTPIQYPANDGEKGVITTHFDYHSISGRILKLDLLGHDVPTQLKQLKDLTGIDPYDIPLDDKNVMSIFNKIDALKIIDKEYPEKHATFGIPEFGTKFVRGMLDDIKPSKFSELVNISGLSHGTDVWVNNAQDLVKSKTIEFSEAICTRDDIMKYLIDAGLPFKDAFFIMEDVRKGKGLKDNQRALMIEHNVPEWYIESCQRIKYMFPRAHAVAYVMASVRIAFFKVYYPKEYYATIFSAKVEDFDAHLISQGKRAIRDKMNELASLQKRTQKDENLYQILELAQEMYARGFICENVCLEKSKAADFQVSEKGIIPPFSSLTGLGINAALSLEKVRNENNGEFMSIQEIKDKTKLNKVAIEALKEHGCLKHLPEDNQFSLEMFL